MPLYHNVITGCLEMGSQVLQVLVQTGIMQPKEKIKSLCIKTFNLETLTAMDASPPPRNSATLPSRDTVPGKLCNTHDRPASHKGHGKNSCDATSRCSSIHAHCDVSLA